MADQFATLHQQAITALNTGDFPRLVKLCQTILQQDPKYADAWFLLAIAADAARNLPKAIELANKALSLAGDNSEYLAQKARFHLALNQDNLARTSAERALAGDPGSALTLDTLGVVLTKLGEYERAQTCLAQAVAKKPQHPQFHFNLASAEQFLGNIESAAEHYQRAIDLAPTFARAYWALSELEKNRVDDRHLQNMQSLLTDSKLSVDDRLYLGHAVFRALEQAGDYAGAFDQLVSCKKPKRQQIGYQFDTDREIFDAMKTAFAEAPPAGESQGVASTKATKGLRPLFVLGMPRSGTTLVERILSSHSQVESLGELRALPLAVYRTSGVTDNQVLTSEVISKAANANKSQVADTYIKQLSGHLNKLDSASNYLIDKLPLNFLYLGFIRQTMPEARIICVRRNPADTILSNFRQLFAIDFSHYQYHYDLEDTARYYLQFHQLMQHWQSLYGDQLLQVSYDQLVSEPETVTQTMLEYLDIDWQAQCLKFHLNPTAVATASSAQVREPLYTGASGRWQRYRDQLRPALDILDQAGIAYG